MNYKSAREVKELLSGKGEVAFIDIRETAEYGRGHPFFVSHVPYSILEARIALYVPCKSTTLILIDGGNGVSEKAAKHLEGLGYTDVIVLKWGVSAWSDAGYALYEGISAPSKSFGEVVEHELGTVSITAEQLKARMDKGDDNFIILDGRTPEEFNRMTIPTSTSCPNAELSLRYQAMLARPDQDIIVNCAGRTRSLIGAETLRVLGIPNKVYALENGTMGWKIAGLELEYGAKRSYPNDIDDNFISDAKQKADEMIKEYDIPVVSLSTLNEWRIQDKTTFQYDVRTREEYELGHVNGFRHTPGGQLIQATDQWFATRNGRIVIFDNMKIRAVMTAIWLMGMGHDAYILDPETVTELVHVDEIDIDISGLEFISATDLKNSTATILDARSSEDYRAGHIEGAIWAIRPQLSKLNIKDKPVVIASDLFTAQFIAKDLG
ncbi:MAG: rhodanese-like domain-containing protein, partial [Emcibacteraceae bacterium]|nr:rhodanese-like domain-containing protein [Emcibacteraceae bacterium]